MDQPVILHFLWSLGRAGAERVVFELAKHLPEVGFRVRVAAAGGGGDMVRDFDQAGIPLAIGPEVGLPRRLETIAFMRDQLARAKPAIVHTHLGADAWYQFARLPGVPWVITAHNDDLDDSRARHWLRGRGFRRADQIACVSGAVERYVRKEFHVPERRLQVIPNGIDLQEVLDRGSRPFRDVPMLVSVGRLVEQKGHAHLLKGLAAVRRPWKLQILGEGPLKPALEQLAYRLGIHHRVQIRRPTAQVYEELVQADLFCFPSLWEGQGLAMLEAAAAGLPILASDLPVFRETFSSTSVRFVSVGSPEDWTRAVERALADPRTALKRATEARVRVWRRHALDPMVRSYAALYHDLLKRRV